MKKLNQDIVTSSAIRLDKNILPKMILLGCVINGYTTTEQFMEEVNFQLFKK